MDKIKTIIIDDENIGIDNLKKLLYKYCPNIQIVSTSKNIDDAIWAINTYKPELVFLDIQLGNVTGFDLLNKLNQKTFEVIFVTAYDHYTMKAIKTGALDYILKPIDSQELMQAVNKVEKKINSNHANHILETYLNNKYKEYNSDYHKIALPQQKETRYVSTEDILRCEADNVYTLFFLNNGEKLMISKTLKEYTEILEPYNFIRIHNSHLVNRRFIKSLLKEDGGLILLENGQRLPISKAYKDKVKYLLSSSI